MSIETFIQKSGNKSVTLKFEKNLLDYVYLDGKSNYPSSIPYSSIYLENPSSVFYESKWNRNLGFLWVAIGLFNTYTTKNILSQSLWFIIGGALIYMWQKEKVNQRVLTTDFGDLILLENNQTDEIMERIQHHQEESRKNEQEEGEKTFKNLFLSLMAEMILSDEKIAEEEITVACGAYQQLLNEEISPIQFQIFLDEFGQLKAGKVVRELQSLSQDLSVKWKEAIIAVSYQLMIADGVVREQEEKLLGQYASALDLSRVHFDGIIQDCNKRNTSMDSDPEPDF